MSTDDHLTYLLYARTAFFDALALRLDDRLSFSILAQLRIQTDDGVFPSGTGLQLDPAKARDRGEWCLLTILQRLRMLDG